MSGVVRTFSKGASWFGSSFLMNRCVFYRGEGRVMEKKRGLHVESLGVLFRCLGAYWCWLSQYFFHLSCNVAFLCWEKEFFFINILVSVTHPQPWFGGETLLAIQAILCVLLNEDVLSFHMNSSYSRKGAFMHVQIFSHNMMVSGEHRMSIQRLDQFYNIAWLCGDLFTCNQVRLAKHGIIKTHSEDIESSAASAAETMRMLLLEVWERRFSFRFEVKSFKPGGTDAAESSNMVPT